MSFSRGVSDILSIIRQKEEKEEKEKELAKQENKEKLTEDQSRPDELLVISIESDGAATSITDNDTVTNMGNNIFSTAPATEPKPPRKRLAQKRPAITVIGDCPICAERFNVHNRRPVECTKCQMEMCRQCVSTYVVSSPESVHCMSCRQPWSRQFLAENMTTTFMSKTYKTHRENVAFDRERSMLPLALPFVSMIRKTDKAYKDADILRNEAYALSLSANQNDQRILQLKEMKKAKTLDGMGRLEMKDLKQKNNEDRIKINGLRNQANELCNSVAGNPQRITLGIMPAKERLTPVSVLPEHIQILVDNGQPAEVIGEAMAAHAANVMQRREERQQLQQPETEVEKELPTFVTRGHCPKADCNGFIAEGWMCPVCSTKICAKCMETVSTSDNDIEAKQQASTHKCSPEQLASVQLIRTDCKPCPKCRVRVHKIIGCSQMFCTACHTTFDWNSGKEINTKYFHNPHFFEWQRSQAPPMVATNEAPRENICGENVTQRDILNSPSRQGDQRQLNAFLNYLMSANEMADVNNRRITIIERDHKRHLVLIRAKYLMGKISEEGFKCYVQRFDKKLEKCRERHAIGNMYSTVIRDVLAAFSRGDMPQDEAKKTLLETRDFTTNTVIEMNKWFGHGVPKNPIESLLFSRVNRGIALEEFD